jgi:hypothetical protein
MCGRRDKALDWKDPEDDPSLDNQDHASNRALEGRFRALINIWLSPGWAGAGDNQR